MDQAAQDEGLSDVHEGVVSCRSFLHGAQPISGPQKWGLEYCLYSVSIYYITTYKIEIDMGQPWIVVEGAEECRSRLIFLFPDVS